MFRRITPRRILILSAWLVGLLAAGWTMLRIPPVLRWIVQVGLETSTGTDVEVVDASWDGWGTLSVGRVRVFASDWPGAAGELLTLRGFRSSFHPLALLWGRLDLDELNLDSAELHIAERERPDFGEQLNLQAIHPPTGGLGLSPSLRVQRINLGRFSVSKFLVRGIDVMPQGPERAFRGDMAASGTPNTLAFHLVEVDAADASAGAKATELPQGISVKGEWNDRTFEYSFEANRLDFTETVRPLLPLALQRSCDAMGLRGTVSDISMRGSPARPIAEAQALISNVAVNLLKLDLPTTWNRFSVGQRGEIVGRPRMAVDRGRIELKGDRLSLRDFSGKLVSVGGAEGAGPGSGDRAITVPLPATLQMDLDFSGLTPPATLPDAEAWFEDALTHCGVDINLRVPDFALIGKGWSVELPEQVVNVLDNFRVKGGHIEIEAGAKRAPSPVGVKPAAFELAGTLRIRSGEGSYINFPYPLKYVDADIGFKGETMHVRSLTATGSDNCRMLITGTVDGADDDAGVDLTVSTTTDAPIDLALERAFEPGPRRMFELLFARELHARLVQAGLLAEKGTELGGHCRFRIRVQREHTPGAKVVTTGEVTVLDARVLCSRFPYPIFVDKGTIELQDEAIVLPEGAWEFTTAGGGSGSIHGRIRIPRVGKGRDALPELNLWVSNDRINPLLLAAIPVESWEREGPAPDGWPGTRMSTASTCMAALQMTGTVGIMGTIGSAQDGSTTLNLELGLADGAFRPRNGPDRLLERSGLPWPAGFDVTDVEATALLTDKLATLVKLTGKAGDGSVTATGTASLQSRDRELVAKLRNAPLGLWLTPMLPAGVRNAATATWQRCQAAGTFDGDLTVHQDATGADRRHASFQCRGIRFVADGKPCELRAPLGHIVIDGPTLRLDGLELEAIGDGRLLGSMQVDGDIALEHGASQALAGCWNIAEIAGPFWPTVLQAANLDDIARLHRRWNAGGSARGSIEVGARRPGGVDWRLQVDSGARLIGDPEGVPVAMELAEGATLSVGPGRFGLHPAPGSPEPPLQGRVPGGEFSIGGELAIGPGGPADGGSMQLGFDLGPFDPSVMRVLPADLCHALQTIDLRAGHIQGDGLRLTGWTGERPSPGVVGGIELQDGAMQVGTRIDRINARFGIDAHEGRPQPVVIDLGGGRGTFAVRDRYFDATRGTLRISEGARRIDIDDLRASLYGGNAWAQARIGGDERDWQLQIGVAGASLAGLTRGGDGRRGFADRGDVNAWLSLGGELDGAGSLRGVGRLEARQARMAELPMALRLLQATQLMLPLADSLDTAEAGFNIRDRTLRFERLDLTCPTLKLIGSGSLDLSSWEVALRFRNRGTVPLLSDLFGAASDNLFVIDVNGPASDPSVKLTPLPPLGQDPSSQPIPPRVAAAGPEKP